MINLMLQTKILKRLLYLIKTDFSEDSLLPDLSDPPNKIAVSLSLICFLDTVTARKLTLEY